MDLHNLRPTIKKQSVKRIGRGGKRGTTSGRGTKGQKSRSGHKIRPASRDMMVKIPKRRGFKFKSLVNKFAVIRLGDLENNFGLGEKVSPKLLKAKGLIVTAKGALPKIKVLGGGQLTKKLILEGLAVSQPAAEKIMALGGEVRNPKTNG